jgi:hypothetical protein
MELGVSDVNPHDASFAWETRPTNRGSGGRGKNRERAGVSVDAVIDACSIKTHGKTNTDSKVVKSSSILFVIAWETGDGRSADFLSLSFWGEDRATACSCFRWEAAPSVDENGGRWCLRLAKLQGCHRYRGTEPGSSP